MSPCQSSHQPGRSSAQLVGDLGRPSSVQVGRAFDHLPQAIEMLHHHPDGKPLVGLSRHLLHSLDEQAPPLARQSLEIRVAQAIEHQPCHGSRYVAEGYKRSYPLPQADEILRRSGQV